VQLVDWLETYNSPFGKKYFELSFAMKVYEVIVVSDLGSFIVDG
jgi:hypothetical protein